MAKNIEIKTAHNIVVYYELATLSDRILANLLDLFLLAITLSIAGGIMASIGFGLLGGVISFLLFSFYHLLCEIMNDGQSIGKRALSIKVVNLKGIAPNHQEAFQRWVFRMLDITFSLGSLACLFITSSPKNQRLGDLIAGCTVIKLKKSSDIDFDRILRMQDREREIAYPSVVKYTDKDMLLVKEVLSRHQKFRNESSRKAVRSLSKKISSELKVSRVRLDHKEFLQDILKDYVSLTR